MASSPRMVTSKLTARAQTTLPSAVRKVLGLEPGSYIGYEIVGDQVRLVNAEQIAHHDPTLDAFLDLLARSIAADGGGIRPVPVDVVTRAVAATTDVAIDHEAPIVGAIDL